MRMASWFVYFSKYIIILNIDRTEGKGQKTICRFFRCKMANNIHGFLQLFNFQAYIYLRGMVQSKSNSPNFFSRSFWDPFLCS